MAYFEREPPPAGTWSGYVAERDGRPVGFAVVRGLDGRRFASVDSREPLPPITMHRTALLALADLARRGVRVVHAYCDTSIPGAEAWLKRLGFVPAPQLTVDPDHPMWVRNG